MNRASWPLLAIAFLGGARVTPAQSAPRSATADTALARFVDALVDSSMSAERIPGAALVIVRDGHVVISKGYGFANLETRTPVDPSATRFRIGSISKALTSLAVLQLIDRGAITADDPVEQHVKGLSIVNRFDEPVRVRHLLTHTAGFDQLGDSGRVSFSPAERLSIETFLRGHLHVVRPPGTASSYDTWGMTLAGLLVERASGMPYAEYMRRQIFAPLGMSHADVETPESGRSSLAPGYAFLDGRHVPQRYEYYSTTPASSIDATVDDMGRLMLALLGDGANSTGRVLSPSGVKRLSTAQFSNLPGMPAYTYGFWEDSINGERVIHHGGNMLEYESEMFLLPARRLGVYVAYNHDGEAGGQHTQMRNTIQRRLMSYWFAAEQPLAPPVALPIDTKRFDGFYATGAYCHTCAAEGMGWNFDYYRIESVGPGMLAIGASRWRAVDSTTFVSDRDPRRRLGFILDAQGRVVRSVLGLDVRERLDERLIEEVLGPQWRRSPTPAFAARVYRTSENWPKCVEANLDRARLNPADGRAWYYGGYCAVRGGEPARAIPALTKAWEVGPWQRPAALQLAIAYAGANDADHAFEWLRKSAELKGVTARMLDGEAAFAKLRSDPRYVELRSSLP